MGLRSSETRVECRGGRLPAGRPGRPRRQGWGTGDWRSAAGGPRLESRAAAARAPPKHGPPSMAPQKLIESSLSQFAAQLAERTPTPGGGSMAAYLAASGAALVAMACRFTSGDKFAAVQAAATATADALDELRPAALGLVDRDARAYDAVTAAFAHTQIHRRRRKPRAPPRSTGGDARRAGGAFRDDACSRSPGSSSPPRLARGRHQQEPRERLRASGRAASPPRSKAPS
jgi:hypothetical protein